MYKKRYVSREEAFIAFLRGDTVYNRNLKYGKFLRLFNHCYNEHACEMDGNGAYIDSIEKNNLFYIFQNFFKFPKGWAIANTYPSQEQQSKLNSLSRQLHVLDELLKNDSVEESWKASISHVRLSLNEEKIRLENEISMMVMKISAEER